MSSSMRHFGARRGLATVSRFVACVTCVDGGSLGQAGKTLQWDPHGYYEVALDAGMLSWAP